MIAFLVFLALMTAFIVCCVCISMYLYRRNWTGYLSEHQLVTLSQEAFVEGRSRKQRKSQLDVGMRECVQRVFGISLGTVAMIVLLTIVFFNVIL